MAMLVIFGAGDIARLAWIATLPYYDHKAPKAEH